MLVGHNQAPAHFLLDMVKRGYKEVGLRDRKGIEDAKSYQEKLGIGMEGQQI
jgi:hypothetical protein